MSLQRQHFLLSNLKTLSVGPAVVKHNKTCLDLHEVVQAMRLSNNPTGNRLSNHPDFIGILQILLEKRDQYAIRIEKNLILT